MPRTATNKNLTWSSSNTSIATVSNEDARSANINGVSPGRDVITTTTQSVSTMGTTVVQIGPAFSANLTGWTSTNQSQWIPTADGIAGYFDLDSNYRNQFFWLNNKVKTMRNK
ncbi:Ig-like domain-containing protein [Paenibacillus alginolyticus]|uniref:Ig-like domain-containing protein n=1 Tax=Paenibacillus alginolyticus TaxID=59839 RepID=UPI0013768F6A|nr:Ig-like domain-containing protein [Paenibacillus alginolyticus]